ncbi:MAG: hypothetical protein WC430_00650 [Patescibacteria group bacterium]
MKLTYSKFIFFSLILSLFFCAFAEASTLSVSPVVLDEKVKARDILKESLTVTNTSDVKLNIFTFVNNISAEDGQQSFSDPTKADLSSSLANWIEIGRGAFELLPGEKKKIDFLVGVNMRALPGIYHAAISFSEGSTRDEAEKKLAASPAMSINIEVLENAKERLELKKFISTKTFFTKWPISVSYILENIGDKALAHSGDVRIYNRNGEEVAIIKPTGEEEKISPKENRQFSVVWNGDKFGRYKALLDVEYGAGQRNISDTIFFWVLPLRVIAPCFLAGLILLVVLPIFWRRVIGKNKPIKK